jgi:hypothetical protein
MIPALDPNSKAAKELKFWKMDHKSIIWYKQFQFQNSTS